MSRMTGTHRTVMFLAFGICFMSGLAWASVPLYRMFCQVTGLNGTTGRGVRAPGAVDGKMTIAFDTNVAPALKWTFKPEVEQETIDIGARDMAFFTATNTSNRTVTGTATFNVTPAQAGVYFKKIQCFCFTQQTLKAGEQVRMPVLFFVDPKIKDDPDARDIEEITLSYTFHPVDADKNAS